MPFVSDSFTGTTGTALESHVGETGATWTEHPSYTSGALTLSGAGRVRANVAANSCCYASGAPVGPDVTLQASLYVASAAGQSGICARLDPASNTMYLARYSGTQWQIAKYVNGTFSTLGSYTQTLNVGDTYELRFVVTAAAKKLFIKGPGDADFIERVSVTDNTIPGTGQVGLLLFNTGTSGYQIGAFTASNALELGSAGTIATESFTGTDGADVATLTGWIEHGSTAGALVLKNNRARNDAATSLYYHSTAPLSPDYDVQAEVVVQSVISNKLGPAGRISTGADTGYWASVDQFNVRLYRVVAGAASTLGTWAHSLSAGQTATVLLRMRGPYVSVYVDGTLRVGPILDTFISQAGQAGIRAETAVTDSTGYHLDNWSAVNALSSGGTVYPAGVVEFYDPYTKPPDPALRLEESRGGQLVIAAPFADRGAAWTANLAGGVGTFGGGPTWAVGARGPCLTLNGSSQYVDFGPNTDPRLDFSGNLLVFLIVRMRSTAFGYVFSSQNAGGTVDQLGVYSSGGKIGIYQTGGAVNQLGTYTWAAGDELRIVISREHTTTTRRVKTWVNGTADVNVTYTGSITAQSSCGSRALGRAGSYVGAGSYANLDVVECRVWKDGPIATDAEVAALFADPWRLYTQPLYIGQPGTGGGQTLTLTGLASGAGLGGPTLTPGAVAVLLSALASGAAAGQPTFTPGGVSIAPSGIGAGAGLGAVTVTSGLVLNLAALGSTAALGTPVIVPGAVGVTLAGLGSGLSFGSLTLTPGAVTLLPAGVGSGAAVGAPLVVPGAVLVAPAGIAGAAALGQPGISPGAVNVTLSGLASAAAAGAVTITPGPVTVALSGIPAGSLLGAVVIRFPDSITAIVALLVRVPTSSATLRRVATSSAELRRLE